MGGQPVQQQSKHFVKSSTVILNGIAIAALVLDVVTQSNLIKDKDLLAIALALLNILNRFRVGGLRLK